MSFRSFSEGEEPLGGMGRGFLFRVCRWRGVNVFDQTVFEESLWRILKTPYAKGKDHLLGTFYLPLFESGLIVTLDFLPNWESSYGAVWEHNKAQQLGLQIIYL